MESTDENATVDSHVEGNPVAEAGEEFTSYDNPLAKHHPAAYTTFHFPTEG